MLKEHHALALSIAKAVQTGVCGKGVSCETTPEAERNNSKMLNVCLSRGGAMNPAFFVCIGVSTAEPVRVSAAGVKVPHGARNGANLQIFARYPYIVTKLHYLCRCVTPLHCRDTYLA